MNLEIKKDLTSNWFKTLQESFCDDIIKFEKNKTKFKSTNWIRNTKVDEGGGEYRILQGGKIFEKVGVNFSKVYGKFPKQFQKNILGANKDPRFWASGISVVMHMKNPLIPAMHFNTRYICTTQEWFGGGMDVTPSKKDLKEKKIGQDECDNFEKKIQSQNPKIHDEMKKLKMFLYGNLHLKERNKLMAVHEELDKAIVIFKKHKELEKRKPASLNDLLTIPIADKPNWSAEEINIEISNSSQTLLGYVVRWIDQGVGCSKVPDINNIGLCAKKKYP